MSKSLGNSMEPGDIIKQSGADILRLWVAMSDYTQDIRISNEILARAAEAYRKLRNTLRYLLGYPKVRIYVGSWTEWAEQKVMLARIRRVLGSVERRPRVVAAR